MTDMLPVVQADRDAVQAFHRTMADRLMADIKSPDRPKLGEDEGDAGTLVQAFARHREAERERAAKVAEGFAQQQEEEGEGGGREWATARTIAAAIRETPHAE